MDLTRKRLILIIRLLVIISISYLILLTPASGHLKYWAYGFICLYLLSNLLLSYFPERYFDRPGFFYGLILFDIIMVVAGIFLTGMEGTDLYLVFFMIVCLATLGSEFKNLVIVSFLFVFVYGWLLYREGLLQGDMAVSYSLRLPFILVISLFLGYIVDLQTREREKKIKESEERHRSFINNLPIGTYQHTLGEQIRFLLMNRAFMRMFGYGKNDIKARKIGLEFVDAGQKNNLEETLRREGRVTGFVADLLRRDDSVFNARIWARRYMVGAEDIIEGIVIDETELRQAEQALRESEKRLKVAGMASYDLIYEWSLKTDEINWFGDVHGKLGYRPEETIKSVEGWQALIHPDDARPFQEAVTLRRTSREPILNEYRIKHRDGDWRYWSDHSLLLLDENGQPEKWIGVCTDITSRRDLEQQLQQAQKMEAIGALAGGVAHNFNNLLMGIQGYISAMLTDKNTADPDYKHLRNIETTVRKASRLTRNLLGFARGGTYEIQPTDLNDLIHNENVMFGSTKKEIIMHEQLQEDLWVVKVDQNQIQQVLMNLYVNAVQAMPETGGEIHVKTENVILKQKDVQTFDVPPGQYVKVSVRDNGCGMDAMTLKKIFDPFFSTKKLDVGTGLGLSSVYGIVRNHRGFVRVTSEKGRGTSCCFYLPASPEIQLEEEKRVDREATVQGSERVLVVDDEKMVANACARLLRHLGYEVMIADSGEAAIELYEKHSHEIDLVLLDILMPGMGGGETYDRLKKINPRVRVLVSSGFSLNNQAREMLDKGCRGFIQKPYDIAYFSSRLREVLSPDGD